MPTGGPPVAIKLRLRPLPHRRSLVLGRSSNSAYFQFVGAQRPGINEDGVHPVEPTQGLPPQDQDAVPIGQATAECAREGFAGGAGGLRGEAARTVDQARGCST